MANSHLVSVEWLKEHLKDSNIVVLDVTWFSGKDAHDDYKKEHIPGAIHFNIFKEVNNTDVYPRKLPETAIFEKNAREAGVNNDSHVVVYDAEGKHGFFLGGRAWFMFSHFGHSKVSVLDGGLQKWKQAGYETTSELPQVKQGNFKAKVNDSLSSDLDFMRKILKEKHVQVLDSRPTEVYNGKPEDEKSGHFPGAINIPFGANLLDKDNGTFKDTNALQEVFKSKGVDATKPAVVMCNSGMSSCSLLLAAKLAGLDNVTIYQPGFSEWRAHAEESEIKKS